jgi:hypothetical protein
LPQRTAHCNDTVATKDSQCRGETYTANDLSATAFEADGESDGEEELLVIVLLIVFLRSIVLLIVFYAIVDWIFVSSRGQPDIYDTYSMLSFRTWQQGSVCNTTDASAMVKSSFDPREMSKFRRCNASTT